MPDDAGRVYSEELCALEAKRAADMKLKIARTFYGWWAWEPETKTWNWDNDRMRPFYRWLQRMKDANITVALNTGWCSPGDINSTHWNGESPFTVAGDWEQSKQNYADWVSETFHQLIEQRGFTNIKIFVLFTEPQRLNSTSAEGKDAYTCWAEAAKAVHEALVRDGRRNRIKLMGPNEGSTTSSEMLYWASQNCDDYIDIYSSHTYLFEPQISGDDRLNGSNSVVIPIPGGRFSREISLENDAAYEVQIVAQYEQNHMEDPLTGEISFGVFALEQEKWDWASGRLTAGFAIESNGGTKYKYIFFFHGSRKDIYPETHGAATLACAFTNDFKTFSYKPYR